MSEDIQGKFYFEEAPLDYFNKIIFLDIDGTLTADSEENVKPDVIERVRALKQNNEVYLCTNLKDGARNRNIENTVGLKIINPGVKKPSAKVANGVGGKEMVVIGDKIITDWLFAKNIRASFLKTRRKISGQEHLAVKLAYWTDDLIYLLFKPFLF